MLGMLQVTHLPLPTLPLLQIHEQHLEAAGVGVPANLTTSSMSISFLSHHKAQRCVMRVQHAQHIRILHTPTASGTTQEVAKQLPSVVPSIPSHWQLLKWC